MSRRKDPNAVSEYTRKQYAQALYRGHGSRAPSRVPEFEAWPESTRRLYRAAVQWYWRLKGDELRGVTIAKQVSEAPARQRAAYHPTDDEARAFESAGERSDQRAHWLVVKTASRLGVRAMEVLGLQRREVEYAYRYGRLTVLGKGNKERVFHVPQLRAALRELLDTQRADGAAWAVLGELISADATYDTRRIKLTRFMKQVAESAGLDPRVWHPHELRHMFADAQLAAGTSERELQALLGHARLETVARYTHPKPEKFSRNIR